MQAARPSRLDLLTALAISLTAMLAYLPALGSVPLLDWDELIYGEAAREMVESGNFLQVYVNYKPFWEKPPLFFWLQGLGFQVFGVNEAAARLPNVIFFGLTVGLIYLVGRFFRGQQFGWLWAGLLGTGLLPVFYSKYGIIDPVFNFFVILALLCLFTWDQGQDWRWAGGAALSLGLAVTTKGPSALVMVAAIVVLYKIWHIKPLPNILGFLLFGLATALLAGSWFIAETLTHGPWFVESFINYQRRIVSTDDGHPGPIFYHLLVFAVGCFPFAGFVPAGMATAVESELIRFKHLALIWFGVVLVLFSVFIQTKLPHYASLLYVPGSFFAALRLDALMRHRQRPHLWEMGWVLLTGLLLGAVPTFLSYLGQHLALVYQLVPSLTSDPLAVAYLSLPVDWPTWTYFSGGTLIVGTLVGCVLLIRKQLAWGIFTLGAGSLIGINLVWAIHIQRFSVYAQSIPIAIMKSLHDSPTELGFYGPLTFVPPFYARRQVHNPANNQQLQTLLNKLQGKPLQMLVRRPDIALIEQIATLKIVETREPFVLVLVAPTLGGNLNKGQ